WGCSPTPSCTGAGWPSRSEAGPATPGLRRWNPRTYNARSLLRGGAVWQLVGLITRRSQVQILPPLPVSGVAAPTGPPAQALPRSCLAAGAREAGTWMYRKGPSWPFFVSVFRRPESSVRRSGVTIDERQGDRNQRAAGADHRGARAGTAGRGVRAEPFRRRAAPVYRRSGAQRRHRG